MQIPIFAPDFMSPHYGYRLFGPIGVQTIEFELPPPTFNINREVYTPLNMDHPHSVTFARSWGPCGVVLDSHFIMIFFNASPTVPSAAAQFISNQPLIGSRASSVNLNHHCQLDGADTPSYAHSHSHSNSPVPALPLGADHMNYFLSKAMLSQNPPVPSYPHLASITLTIVLPTPSNHNPHQ